MPTSKSIWDYSKKSFLYSLDRGKAEALIGLGRLKEALTAIDQSLSIDPDNIGCLTQKIFIYQQLGKHEDALETIDQILSKGMSVTNHLIYFFPYSLDMFDRETHKHKVRVLFNLNRFDRVVNEIEVIESLFGTSCYNYYLKGINYSLSICSQS